MRRRTRSLMTTLMISLTGICIGDDKKKEPPVDTANPYAVAKAFIVALANKDVQLAAKFVAPEQREEFTKELKKGVPPLPKKPNIELNIKQDGTRADVSLINGPPAKDDGPPFGLDMRLIDGKWWIVK